MPHFLTFPHICAVSPNHLNPANCFKPLDFRQSHSNPHLHITEWRADITYSRLTAICSGAPNVKLVGPEYVRRMFCSALSRSCADEQQCPK